MRHLIKLLTECLIVISLLILSIVNPSFSQAFGKNKVQYKTFHFKQLNTTHYSIFFYPPESTAVNISAGMLENWYSRYTKIFSVKIPKAQPVILYANQADFQQTNAIPGLIDQATGGVTEETMNRMVIPLTGVFSENNHVLGHELTHAFQYAEIQSVSSNLDNYQTPLWFIEGMAEYLSMGSRSPITSMWMRDAVSRNDVPSFKTIEKNPRYFPYRYGHAIWAYIAGKWGDDMVGTLFSSVVRLGWDLGFSSALGISVDSLSKAWRNDLLTAYSPELSGRTRAIQTGKTLQSSNTINLAPSISPDGKYIAFLSSRDLFSIDLYLADANNGKIIKKLVSSESGEHFEALRFINFSGSWSPTSKSFAFVVFSHGKNAIAIEDVRKGATRKIFLLNCAEEIDNIAWSPDGKKLLISATSGAISNLYLHDLSNNTTTKLTDDLYAEIQPCWSPDGKTIAFATDHQQSDNLDSIPLGKMRIGLIKVGCDSVSYLSIVKWANHINPQFSPDGKSLYFISDPDGINNIYRYSFINSTYYKVTNVITGVNGLTSLSPAMSVSSKSGRIVFNVFDNKDYLIQTLDSTQTQGTAFTTDYFLFRTNATLPPKNKSGGFVNKYLANPDIGLDTENCLGIKKYHPKLKLWYVGQITAGLGVSPFGVSAGGQANVLFSDILGDHILGIGLQTTGTWSDLGGSVAYINQRSRLNWGYIVSHFPYATSRVLDSGSTININGEPATISNTTIIDERVYEEQASAFASFPLSIHRRFELRGGYLRIGYSNEAAVVQGPDTLTNINNEVTVNPPPAINQAQFDGALVGDYSYYGFTGPVKGRRYRFEIQPAIGSLFFTDIMGDLRYYKFIRPVTLGFRIFSWGRYFGQSQNNSLPEAYLGYEDWMRGYSMGSFNLSNNTSPEFERLLGTSVAVANAEIRIPLLGTDQLGIINFPYIPLDIVGFFDSGVAWTSTSPVVWRIERNSNQRIPVFSTGAAVRFNLLGYLVFQIYSAYPFQRPGDGWQWGFFIAPGW